MIMKTYCRAPDVLWNTVGVSQEEALLIKEERVPRIFIVSGKSGAAIWSRLDGAHTPEQISEEMAVAQGLPCSEALAIIAAFLEELEESGLITDGGNAIVPQPIVDWPETTEVPTLAPLELDTLVTDDMVALASFVGGRSNVGGNGVCQVGPGGKNNTTGSQPVCHN